MTTEDADCTEARRQDTSPAYRRLTVLLRIAEDATAAANAVGVLVDMGVPDHVLQPAANMIATHLADRLRDAR